MCGGNPSGDAYGFRYWNEPGAFAEHITSGSLGRFEGFLACLWNGVFTVCGPEYIAIIAAEAKFPRKYLKQAFKTTFYRFVFFFIGSALCVGIVIAYNDPTLVRIYSGTGDRGQSTKVLTLLHQIWRAHLLPRCMSYILVPRTFVRLELLVKSSELAYLCVGNLSDHKLHGRTCHIPLILCRNSGSEL